MPYFRSALVESSSTPTNDKKPSSDDDRGGGGGGDILPPTLPLCPKRADSWESERPQSSLEVIKQRCGLLTPLPSLLPLHSLPPLAPAPETPAESSRSTKSKEKKTARIGLRVHWTQFKRKIGIGEDTSIDFVVAGSTEHTSWERRCTEVDDAEEEVQLDTNSVDEVVVDRLSGHDSMTFEEDNGPDKTGGDHHFENGEMMTNGRESPLPPPEGFWGLCNPLLIARWRLWPLAVEFFSPQLTDEKEEQNYRREIWFQSKPLALWSSLFYVLNWALGCALIPKPFTLADNIFFFGIVPVFTLPIPIFVIFDFARDRPYIYHLVVTLATWCWSFYLIFFIFACGYYSGDHRLFHCGKKDFLSIFYFTSALQTTALFGLKLNRLPAMLGAMVFLVMSASMIVPYRISWIRHEINFVIFQSFLLYIHYKKDTSERRLYILRDKLKLQFKATQKAQVLECKASESKRRLTSYVFHEVRVPLNTALIAVQNMEASQTMRKEHEVEFSALTGSLSMMSKVLNDVLDFNRMDSGRLETVSVPYAFHSVMRSMFVPLQLATDARKLRFITDLDKSIDVVARRAAWEFLSAQQRLQVQDGCNTFERHLDARPDDDGIVVGDEMRLRQVVTNLVSNACKFTPSGGTLTVRTRLIAPDASCSSSERHVSRTEEAATAGAPRGQKAAHECDLEKGDFAGLSAKSLLQHDAPPRKGEVHDRIIVRIEVSDTGCGISAKDIANGKLFSAFNQTEQGRLQGGKGTGLGLALVRHIVSLSGGRLGVQSKVGIGSTFWVELPLGVGRKAVSGTDSTGSEPSKSMERKLSEVHYQAKAMVAPLSSMNALMLQQNTDSSDIAVEESSRNSHAQVSQSSSALRSIMEQGGLVELAPTRFADGEHQIPTRAIGDPSTGTDACSNDGSSFHQEGDHSPSMQDLVDERQAPSQSQSQSQSQSLRERPSFVELPKRPSFNLSCGPSGAARNLASRLDLVDPPLCVLVVDDDQLTRKLMKRMLQRLGCTVSTAENGQIAFHLIMGEGRTPVSETSDPPGSQSSSVPGTPSWELAGSRWCNGQRYEVVFLDNQMPVLSGLDLVTKLRQLGRTEFIVGVTGNALLSDQEQYREAGVDYVITKPVFEVSLKGMLGIAAERRKMAQHR